MRCGVFIIFILYYSCVTASGENLDITKRNAEETHENRVEHLQSAGLALSKAFIAVLGVTNPLVGVTLAVGIEVLGPIIDAVKEEQDIWDQIESKVDDRIGEKLSTSKISSYKDLLFDFNKRMKKGRRFAVSDLDFIIGKMEAVIPFDSSLGWDYELPLMMVHYIPYLIASYQEIMKKDNELPVCELANDMNLYRSKVILGCKEMIKKRYKLIHDNSWDRKLSYCHDKRHNPIHKHNTSDRKAMKRLHLNMKSRCSLQHTIYEDAATGDTFKLISRKGGAYNGSWEDLIDTKVRKPTVDFLYKNVIEKINKYFIDDICLKTQFGCKCPEPITREEIDFRWPLDCYGESHCIFPAGKFGESYTWCYEKGNGKTWNYSERYDLDTCMPVNRHTVKPLNVMGREK